MRHASSILAVVAVLAIVAVTAAGPFFDTVRSSAPAPRSSGEREIAETIWFQGYL
ncbi:MAG: hypothetical protein GF405_04590, partial [Candidatus Eisenbacteria bacterium]|nr:hypothetical protein [Candidatus Eisenbacteria bacterium]